MSLGLSRDSLANLQSLVHNSEKDDYTLPPSSTNFIQNDEDSDDDGGTFLIESDEEEIKAEIPASSLPIKNSPVVKSGPAEIVTVVQDLSTGSPVAEKSNPGKNRRSPRVKPANSPGAYAGFVYQEDYYTHNFEQTAYGFELNEKKGENPICCLFPFLKDPLDSDSDYDDCNDSISESSSSAASISNNNQQVSITVDSTPPSITVQSTPETPRSLDVTQNTSDSASFVTADSAVTSSSVVSSTAPATSINTESSSNTLLSTESEDEKEELSSIINSQDDSQSQQSDEPKVKPLKGILKHTVVKAPVQNDTRKPTRSAQLASAMDTDSSKKRRSILPTYMPSYRNDNMEDAAEDGSTMNSKKSVTFSAMARVMPVLARTEMSLYLKAMIWWQRSDYDDFKKAGRIIAKAMLQGGSEIWLETSNAWGKKQEKRVEKKANNGASSEYISALRKYGAFEEEKTVDENDNVGNKWWCKFGHSRRGLEHIVSIEEGRQRQRLVNASVTAVLEEQRRQRVTRGDHKKISAISMQYTSWAKDLALAAGAADEEAVKSNFSSNKHRISYLKSKLLKSEKKVGHPCARFILSANPALTAEILDTHTHHRRKISNVVKDNHSSETKSDVAHQAAGFQYQA